MTDTTDWLAGYHQALDDAAAFYLAHTVQAGHIIEARVKPSGKKRAMATAIRGMKWEGL